MSSRLLFFLTLILAFPLMVFAANPISSVMPLPVYWQQLDGRLAITRELTVAVSASGDVRLRDGVARMLRRVEQRAGLTFARVGNGDYAMDAQAADANIVIDCVAPALAWPALGEDESYTWTISSAQAVLRAPTVLGALHGLGTGLQLLQSDENGWFLPATKITDQPRFPWRGLMIDVARHWQPLEVIKRNLDGMALVKLNVLHLHLSDDQGFRIESKKIRVCMNLDPTVIISRRNKCASSSPTRRLAGFAWCPSLTFPDTRRAGW